jgi:hypothetical protein
MNYDCLSYNGKFIIAKPHGWQWSAREREAPFSLCTVGPLLYSPADYLADVAGEDVLASRINPSLIVEAQHGESYCRL